MSYSYDPRMNGRNAPQVHEPYRSEAAYPMGRDLLAEGLHVREILNVLRRQWWIVILPGVLALGAGLLLYPKPTPRYTARAAVQVLNARRAVAVGIEDQGSDRVGRYVDPLLSYVEILRGRAVLGQVVDRENLRFASLTPGVSRSSFSDLRVAPDADVDSLRLEFTRNGYVVHANDKSLRANYGEPVELYGVAFTLNEKPTADTARFVVRSRDAAIDMLRARMGASPRADTDIIDVTFTDPDPERAQKLVNAIVEANRDYSIETAQDRSRKRRQFLEKQLQLNSERLAEAQVALTAFRSAQGFSTSRDKLSQQMQSLDDLQLRLEELTAELRMHRNLLNVAQRTRDNGDALRALASAPGLNSNPVVSQLYSQLARYETIRDSLTTSVGKTSSHPDVVRVSELITSTRARMLDATRSHIASAEARADAMTRLLGSRSTVMQRLPQVEAEEQRFAQDVESIRSMGNQIRTDLQKAEMAEAIEAGQIEVVELAPVPQSPSSSRRPRKLFFLVALGFMVGTAGAFSREALDTSVRRHSDLVGALRQQELAMIPRIETGPRVKGRKLAALPARRTGTSLLAVAAPRSAAAEAYRTLRTNLLFSQAFNGLRKIVITSAAPQEGKSTTAANLASAFAQQGIATVLVDADLRAPSLHTMFGMPMDIGVTTVLEGGDTLDRAVRGTRIDNLWLLPSGPTRPAAAELVGGPKMRALLDELASRFALVIIDTPPVLAAADASVLAAESDGVVLVVRAGGTELGVAQHALQQLEAVSANIIGAVLNDPDAELPKYREYGYSYGYGATNGAKS